MSILQVCEKTVCVGQSVKKLGVYFGMSLTIEKQLNAISKACYCQIRNICHIRRYIASDACKIFAHVPTIFRLDFSQSLPILSAKHTRYKDYRIQLPDWSSVLVNMTI